MLKFYHNIFLNLEFMEHGKESDIAATHNHSFLLRMSDTISRQSKNVPNNFLKTKKKF